VLVDDNFKYYAAQFGNDRSAFREQMARNWLAKHKAFALLAEKSGMTRIRSADARYGPPQPNEASFAILTQNASYLYVGPGAFDRAGPGAPYRYRHIPLRGVERSNFEGQQSFYFSKPPSTGRVTRASISSGPWNTSPIVCIYTATFLIEQSRKVAASLNVALDQTFAYTDGVTLSFFSKRIH
jgi:hypothetical protein